MRNDADDDDDDRDGDRYNKDKKQHFQAVVVHLFS